jgi:hypothetical protein
MFHSIISVSIWESLLSESVRGKFDRYREISCPLLRERRFIGTAQASFTVYNSLNANRDIINTQAYIKLLEKAQEQYGKDALIDIRDIVWVSHKDVVTIVDTEYSATGKVIQLQ